MAEKTSLVRTAADFIKVANSNHNHSNGTKQQDFQKTIMIKKSINCTMCSNRFFSFFFKKKEKKEKFIIFHNS